MIHQTDYLGVLQPKNSACSGVNAADGKIAAAATRYQNERRPRGTLPNFATIVNGAAFLEFRQPLGSASPGS